MPADTMTSRVRSGEKRAADEGRLLLTASLLCTRELQSLGLARLPEGQRPKEVRPLLRRSLFVVLVAFAVSIAVSPVAQAGGGPPPANVQQAAGTSVHNGTTYYFCALSCKAKFDANPSAYLPPR